MAIDTFANDSNLVRGEDDAVEDKARSTEALKKTAVALTARGDAGWFVDPSGTHRMRFFDGERWTANVTHFGPTPCDGCGSAVTDVI